MKKYVKWTGIVFLSPVILFVLLSILIYLKQVALKILLDTIFT